MKRRRGAVVVEPERHAKVLVPDFANLQPPERLGDLVVERQLAARAEVEAALGDADGRRIGAVLLAAKLIDEVTLAELVAQQLHVPFVDLRTTTPEPSALSLVSETDAHLFDVLPLTNADGVATVVVADPRNPDVQALLGRLPVTEVRVALGDLSHLRARINQSYQALSAVQSEVDAFRASDLLLDQVGASDSEFGEDDAPIVQVVNKIVTQALRDRASDIHIEPTDEGVRIRYRIDGALKQVVMLPADMGPALVSRIKIMAEMNIVERRRPQDGQFEMTIDGRSLDVRVSTTSTIWGEKTVLRLLDRGRALYHLADLGMPDDLHAVYSRIVRSPFGMVIVSGPTGSGKTTTLYATLSEINRDDLNVMTIEDPVEYVFPKINQIQISEQAGLTFATGLKSILRQDPDIILVGEVRDVDTARIAVQSALTGHLVLSSVHAIDAVSAMYRLLDMGVEAFLVTSALVGVVAQRLVRRICRSCAAPYEPTLQEAALYRKLAGSDKESWIAGVGCSFCAGTGYLDRVGVYEVLLLTDEVRQAIVEGHSPRETRALAVRQGLSTLQMEAMRLVTADITTLDEVVRHVFVTEDIE